MQGPPNYGSRTKCSPRKTFHPARKAILSMMKKQYIDETFVIWWNATFPETITLRKKTGPQSIV